MRAMDRRDADHLASRLKALAEPNRMVLLNLVAAEPDQTQEQLLARLGRLTQTTVSTHLRALKYASAIEVDRVGNYNHHHLDVAGLTELADAIRALA